ncbi:MAG TPA: hypothetical protein VGV35_09220 [Bryobacteraceae bacterium]|nr:hypothetical protein [Bryobacteraceae bacterium]
MKRRQKSAVELFEEAVYLVRSAPASLLAAYYVGALPFILGLLFFWADMTQNAVAYEHCAPASLAVALLFCWMTYCHAVYVRGLHSELSGAPAAGWFSSGTRRLGFTQVTLQPSKFLVLPAAALTVLPFAGAFSFYQNLMALTHGECPSLARAVRAARKHSSFWQQQNWLLLAILVLLNFVVLLNIGTAILILPYLLKVFLGIDTTLALSGASAFNTTFVAVTASLAYLVTNPVAKAVYLLRYFYAESRETGEDLRADYKTAERTTTQMQRSIVAHALLRSVFALVRTHRSRIVATIRTIACVVFFLLVPNSIQPQPTRQANPSVSAEQLNQAIEEVIHRPEFTWRMPRPPRPPENNPNWFVRATESFLSAMGRTVRQIAKWVDDFINWIGDKLKHLLPGLGGNQPAADSRKLRLLIYTLLAGVALVLGWLLWQVWRHKKRKAKTLVAAVALPAVELNNPDLQADQQPLDEWLLLARDCMSRQEFRLALRALYLAGLAYLADRSLIAIQRGKSNHDYERELRRKARDKADLLTAFQQNLGVFERTWYGMYDVDQGIVEQFETTLARIRGYANQQ